MIYIMIMYDLYHLMIYMIYVYQMIMIETINNS